MCKDRRGQRHIPCPGVGIICEDCLLCYSAVMTTPQPFLVETSSSAHAPSQQWESGTYRHSDERFQDLEGLCRVFLPFPESNLLRCPLRDTSLFCTHLRFQHPIDLRTTQPPCVMPHAPPLSQRIALRLSAPMGLNK